MGQPFEVKVSTERAIVPSIALFALLSQHCPHSAILEVSLENKFRSMVRGAHKYITL